MNNPPSKTANERHLRTTKNKYFSAVAFGVLVGACIVVSDASQCLADDSKAKAVIELFTSQGCSSCPPADALLSELAKRDDVIALTLPVNYWDHLGWRDTLAKEAFTERQHSYAQSRGDREIYTPQMVVNGVAHVIGSRAEEIAAALRSTDVSLSAARVQVAVARDDGHLSLHAGTGPDGSNQRSGTLWVAFFSHAVPVEIRRGENLGHRIVYTNVVRTLVPAGHWDGYAVNYRVAIPRGADVDGCAAFLQADETKAVLGAAAANLPTN